MGDSCGKVRQAVQVIRQIRARPEREYETRVQSLKDQVVSCILFKKEILLRITTFAESDLKVPLASFLNREFRILRSGDRNYSINRSHRTPPPGYVASLADEKPVIISRRRIVAPKREKLQAALESLRQKEAALEEAMRQLRNLQEELERLQQMYDAKMKEKEDLIRLASTLVFLARRSAGNGLV